MDAQRCGGRVGAVALSEKLVGDELPPASDGVQRDLMLGPDGSRPLVSGGLGLMG